MAMNILLAGLIVLFLAGFVRGLTAFGLSLVGDRLSHGVEHHTFRRIVILLPIIVGIANIYTGITPGR